MSTEKLRPIAQSYWRLIKKNKKSYYGLDDNMKTLVKELAHTDVINGVITEEQYEMYINDEYVPEQ